MRATPPSLRMSAGTRSSAITATAPASSAIFACSAVVTSMITPPLSISARPVLRVSVPVFFSSMGLTTPVRGDCIDTIGERSTATLNLELEIEGVNRYIVTMTIWSPGWKGGGPALPGHRRGPRRGPRGRGAAQGQPPADPPRPGRAARRHRRNGEPGLRRGGAAGAGLAARWDGGRSCAGPGEPAAEPSDGDGPRRPQPEPPARPGGAAAAGRPPRSARHPHRAERRGAPARLPGRRGKRRPTARREPPGSRAPGSRRRPTTCSCARAASTASRSSSRRCSSRATSC